jgi:hypothetical protein
MQPRDEQALAIWQAHRHSPEIEALLDQFFNYPTNVQYEEQLQCVHAVMSAPVIFTSDLPSHLSGAL